jgi:hypothetical protein
MPQPGARERSATLAMVQAAVALALLIVLPIVVGTPETTQGIVAAGAVALVLFTFLVTGIARFMRNRKIPYPDSMMPTPLAPGERKPPTARKED